MKNSINEELPPFKKNNISLNSRYVTGLILILIVALILYFNIKVISFVAVGICYFLAFSEALKLYNIKSTFALYFAASINWLIVYYHPHPVIVAIFIIVIIACTNLINPSKTNRNILPFIYPVLPFNAFFEIYIWNGQIAIIWLIVVVCACDITAYFAGRLFGRSPLSSISPKKTMEGAMVGLIIATIIGFIIGIKIKGFLPSLLISFTIALLSIFGDLFESKLKRTAGVKDSGNILPGHGGILDRVDALLFASIGMLFFLGWIF